MISTDLSPDSYKDVGINNEKTNDAEIHRNVIPIDGNTRRM